MDDKRTLPCQIIFARELRKNQTATEAKMWNYLRNRRMLGFKFLRQHPIVINQYSGITSFYIADFYCSEKKLVIEVDGLIHLFQIAYDEARNIIMNELGLNVVRFTNDAIEKNIYEVLNTIKSHLR